ncbi:MAG: hypothetical protein ACOYJB_01600 [Christensenellaceae bacterium]
MFSTVHGREQGSSAVPQGTPRGLAAKELCAEINLGFPRCMAESKEAAPRRRGNPRGLAAKELCAEINLGFPRCMVANKEAAPCRRA